MVSRASTVWASAAVVLAVVGGSIFSAAPAFADPILDRGVKPAGTGWIYGVPIGKLPSAATLAAYNLQPGKRPDGGWSNVATVSSGRYPSTALVRPAYLRLDEPAVVAGALYIGWTTTAGTDTRAGVGQAQVGVGQASGTVASFITCSSAEWAQSSTLSKYQVTMGGVYSLTAAQSSARFGSNLVKSSPTVVISPANCPFIVGIETTMVDFFADPTAAIASPGARVITRTVWASEQFASGSFYDEDELAELCDTAEGALAPECVFNLPDDPTNFSQVCAGAPQPEWLNFTWLPRFLSHYGECLFVPEGLPDRKLLVMTAIGHSSLFSSVTATQSAVNAMMWSEGCGLLVNVTEGPLDGFQINTCSWGDLSGYKSILSWYLYGQLGLFVVLRGYSMISDLFFRSNFVDVRGSND